MAFAPKTSSYDGPPIVDGAPPMPSAYAQPTATNAYPNPATQGVAPPQGVYMPPQGVYMPPQGAYLPPPGYYALPGTAVPVHVAVSADPATGAANPPYFPGPQASYQYPYATADGVVITVVQPMYAAPPTAQQASPSGVEVGRWSIGLCDCCRDCVPNLLMAWCCPCVSLAQVYARLGIYTYQAALARFVSVAVVGVIMWYFLPVNRHDVQGHWDANGDYVYEPRRVSVGEVAINLIYLAIQLGFAFYVFGARMHVRQRFQIPGDACGDCLVSCCCSCCAIAQMATHVKSYRPGDCSFGGPDVLPPFN